MSEDRANVDVPVLTWQDCYSSSWAGGVLHPSAFAHPAKFSRALVERIVSFGLEQGFWEKGDVVLVTPEILREIEREVNAGQFRRTE